jgi:thioredoxin 1
MHVKEKADFDNQIKEGKVLVDFFATWCGPCKMLSPLVESLSKEHDELKVLKVDVDEAEAIAAEYNIYSIPTLIYFENGKAVRTSDSLNGGVAAPNHHRVGIMGQLRQRIDIGRGDVKDVNIRRQGRFFLNEFLKQSDRKAFIAARKFEEVDIARKQPFEDRIGRKEIDVPGGDMKQDTQRLANLSVMRDDLFLRERLFS